MSISENSLIRILSYEESLIRDNFDTLLEIKELRYHFSIYYCRNFEKTFTIHKIHNDVFKSDQKS